MFGPIAHGVLQGEPKMSDVIPVLRLTPIGTQPSAVSQKAHKRLVNVYITFTIAFRIGSECPFIERLVLVKTFS